MKDFNFDELDKAVSSMLRPGESAPNAGAPLVVPSAKPAVPASADIPSSLRPAATPKAVSTSNVVVTPRTSINRSGGRPGQVVDIMAPGKRPSRQASSLQPTAEVKPPMPQSVPRRTPTEDASLRWPKPAPIAMSSEKPEQSQVGATSSEAKTPSPDPAPVSVPISTTVADDAPVVDSFERFDGLSRRGFDFDDDSQKLATQPADAEPTSSIETKTETAPAEPPTGRDQLDDLMKSEPALNKELQKNGEPQVAASPFLADAKVEKRPLGGYAPPTPSPESTTNEPAHHKTNEGKQAQKPPAATDADPVVTSPKAPVVAGAFSWPADDSFLDDTPTTAAADTAAKEPSKPAAISVPSNPRPAPTIKLDHLLSDGHEHIKPTPPNTSTNPGTLDSIPQQYKVAQQPAGDTAHPIFDTKEYHAPVAADTPRKRGGVTLLIIVIVLLLIAAAAVAGFYFFGEQLGF